MTQWTRTIGRQITNALPAWRLAMTSTNTLYEIGDLPSVAASSISWPSAGAGNALMSNNVDGNSAYMHYGYGGSVWAADRGAHGALIFGTTGEGCISNQLTEFTLSDATPTWAWFQQPSYATSLSEANAMNADWYYNEAEYAALAANKKITDEAAFSAGWDGTFPVGYKNWIARRKYQTSITGNNKPHFFRYDMPCWIPSSMTGTGEGAIIVTNYGTIYGPFGQGAIPSGGSAAAWFADVTGSSRTNYLWACGSQTKSWQRLTNPLPSNLQAFSLMFPMSCVDVANKAVWYLAGQSGNNILVKCDFTAGLSGMTTSTVAITDLTGGAQPSFEASSVLCVPASGALVGKRLWFARDSLNSQLLLIDLDALTMRKLAISGIPTGDRNLFAYDAANNILHITTLGSSSVTSYRMSIPTSYTSAAAYSVSSTAIAMNGITPESGGAGWQYGKRNLYIPSLGVICMTQRFNKMLAFRPA